MSNFVAFQDSMNKSKWNLNQYEQPSEVLISQILF